MTKIHLLTRKEDINEYKLKEGTKIAIVLDVLLATTTITSALNDGATEVIPVLNQFEADLIRKNYPSDQCITAGEENAKPIEGFVYPSPLIIRPLIKGKRLILSTTNGTVALRKAAKAKRVYVASLLNNQSVAKRVMEMEEVDTIIVICSGNSGEMSLEDFYGAGDLINFLLKENQFELTDAARAALYFYTGCSKAYDVLLSSRVGQLLEKYNGIDELLFASKIGSIDIVPVLKGNKVVIEHSAKAMEQP